MLFRRFFQLVVSLTVVCGVSLAWGDEARLRKEIADIDKSIAARESALGAQSASFAKDLEALDREISAEERRLERHDRKVERAQERLDFVLSNIAELDKWYGDLGAIDQGLNSGTYTTKKNALNVDKNTAEAELNQLQKEKTSLEESILGSRQKAKELKSKLASIEKSQSSDKQLSALRAQKSQKQKELADLRNRQPAAPVEPDFKAYVYVISGKTAGELEKHLKLKSWVESYQAKYIEANWNDLTGKSPINSGSMISFLSQMDKELDKVPQNSKVILVGYGLGGGAAVLAATEVARKKNRTIELLVTLDPMGAGESRMNAVYETEAFCQGRISPEQYVNCLSKAKKRVISANVKNFYNRWQRESKVPFDASDRMTLNNKEYNLSTGKFLVASKSTESNQKRMYYGDKDAHELLLKDAAEELPKLLVTHLR